MSSKTITRIVTTTIITETVVIEATPIQSIQPTTTGETERKGGLHWSEEDMTVGDLIGTAGDSNIDDLCNRLCHG